MKTKLLLMMLFLVLLIPCGVNATSFVNNFGLSSPLSILTFDEIVFPRNTAINNQYAVYGVTFTDSMHYNAQNPVSYPGISGNYIGNFTPTVNPFSIYFTSTQSAAAFGMATPETTSTITALLNGIVVESFVTPTDFDDSDSFYGFTDITFNEIMINVYNRNPTYGYALIDNIQIGTGNASGPGAPPVPEPSTIMLLGVGMTCLVIYGKRRAQINKV
jgi:hypothetical protein